MSDRIVLTETASLPFTLDSRATGQTFTRVASYIDGVSSVFNPSSTPEIGGGSYLFIYLPLVVGSFIWVGDGTAGDRITVTFEVETAAQADPYAASAAALANLDAAVSSRAPAGALITTSSPVSSTGDVTLVQSFDYNNADSRALDWSTSVAATWPDLTGATIELVATLKGSGTALLTAAGSVVTPTGATKAVRVELTKAQASTLTRGVYDYQLSATLASGNEVPLAADTMTVTERLA